MARCIRRKSGNPGGRPTDYREEFIESVQTFCADGYSLTAFAGEIGVCRDTISEWCSVHPEFSVAVSRAKAKRARWWEERAREIAARGEGAHIDDDMVRLRGRVRRSTSGLAWSEEPPSRARRLLNNVRVQQRDAGLLDVRLNFWVYRSRLERHQDWFVGERFDVLVRDDGPYGYLIADRKIVLEQATVLAPNISVFL